MIYKDLKLKEFRDELGLDFAKHGYERDQCSCCYGPKDQSRVWFSKKYREMTQEQFDEVSTNDLNYIMFKNANNGGGFVTENDEIKGYQCVEWNLPSVDLHTVCIELQKRLGDEYTVLEPSSSSWTIVILYKHDSCYEYNLKRELEAVCNESPMYKIVEV